MRVLNHGYMGRIIPLFAMLAVATGCHSTGEGGSGERGLVGYWKLRGDCRDYSGYGNHGINHGVNLRDSSFNGSSAYIEIPSNRSLELGNGEFTIAAWIYTEKVVNDVIGDVFYKYDPQARRGVTLSVNSCRGGYTSHDTDRRLYFGIDNARLGEWRDCGKPSEKSDYISNSMVVYKGKLYAAVGHGDSERDWSHVYRYEGGAKWSDLGRVGQGKATGAFAMIVHNDELYVATATYDWTRNSSGDYDAGRVYRYAGGTNWVDCGQPADNVVWNTLGTYDGRLFIGGGPKNYGVYVQDDKEESKWVASRIFEKTGAERCYPHVLFTFRNKLYTGYPFIWGFNGREWCFEGDPVMLPEDAKGCEQIHSITVYRGNLICGTWPEAKVAVLRGDKKWSHLGRVGVDGTEVNSLVVYNGKLYGGTLPRSEVARYDDQYAWTSLARFYDPPEWTPMAPIRSGEMDSETAKKEFNRWSRLTSMAVYDGKLFVSTGSCTSSPLDTPLDGKDVLGRVFCMEAGKNISYDHNLGPGWKQITAVRRGNHLELYIDGQLIRKSDPFDNKDYDLTNSKPIKIGFGELDYFNGRITEVKLYKKALSKAAIRKMAGETARMEWSAK